MRSGLARVLFGGFIPPKAGFTLIEMLVVVVIILILVGILLPVVNGARQKAITAQCATNMQQLGIAFKMYINDWEVYPGAGYGYKPQGAGDWVGLKTVYSPSQGDYCNPNCFPQRCGPTNSALGKYVNPSNKPCRETVFWCPIDGYTTYSTWGVSYQMNGNGKVQKSPYKSSIPPTLSFLPASLVASPAGKYLLLEPSDGALLSAGGCNSSMHFDGIITVPTNSYVSDRHGGGSNALYCDGHVKWSLADCSAIPTKPGFLNYDLRVAPFRGFDPIDQTAPGATTE